MTPDAVATWLMAAGREPLLTAAEEIHLGTTVRKWLDHPAGADGAPRSLQRRGQRARDRMVKANLRMVATVARRFNRRPFGSAMSMEDLLQEGALGLQRAAEKFNPERGYKFSTYAYWWIQQGITRALDCQFNPIRVPTNGLALARRFRYRPEGMDLEEFAEQQGLKPERVRQTLMDVAMVQFPASLDVKAKHNDPECSTLGDLVAVAETEDPIGNLDYEVAIAALEAALPEELGLLEQSVVLGRKSNELGRLLDCKPGTVRRHLSQARERLRVVGGEVMQELVA